MSESDMHPASESPVGSKAPRSSAQAPSRSGGWFAVMMALVALLVGGYLYYRLVFIGQLEQLPARVETLDQSVDQQIRNAGEGLESRVQSTLLPRIEGVVSQYQGLDQRLVAMETAVAGLLSADAERAIPPNTDDWKIAEVGYLLRIANHRLLMERNVADAAMLLANADSLLAEIEGFRWHGVREQIASERIALDQVQGNTDVQGIYLALEALKAPLGELLRTLPVLATPTTPADAGANASAWDVLLSRLVDVFRIHRIDAASVKPLLSGDERLFMEQQLRLALEQAQLGALRRQQSVYDTSLGNVKRWLEEEFEPDAPGLDGLLGRIGELATVRLETPLPDISGSLGALQDAVRAMP